MTTDSWCPENELAWIMEQAERRACFMVEENRKLRARLAESEAQRDELKDALERIANYTAHEDDNEQEREILTARNELSEEIKACESCRRAKDLKHPPSGMCSVHYRAFMLLSDATDRMHEYKDAHTPCNIARETLAKLEEK